MQLPDYLNKNNLFLKLNGLGHSDNQALEQVKDEILSRGTSALLHLMRIQDLNKRCLLEFELYENQLNNIKDDKIVYSSESLGYLLNEISPLLGTLRLLQNLSIKLIRILGVKSLPKSINDYIKKPQAHNLDAKLHGAIVSHWNSSGKILKNLRDTDQHYQWLTGRYFLQLKPKRTILVEFPDNPEEKSPRKFKYERKLNGIDFLNGCLMEINELIETIAEFHGANQSTHQQGVLLDQLGELTPFSNRTLSFVYSNYVNIKDDKTFIDLEGIGVDQLETGQLSFRKYFLEGEELEKAKTLYGIKNDD